METQTSTIGAVVSGAGLIIICLQCYYKTITKKGQEEAIGEGRKNTTEILEYSTSGTNRIQTSIKEAQANFESRHTECERHVDEIKTDVATIKSVVLTSDKDGSLLVFTPRSWADSQKEIAQMCGQITNSQMTMQKSQETTARVLQKIMDRLK